MKYTIICKKCGAKTDNFAQWFAQNQQCTCGCKHAELSYTADYTKLKDLCQGQFDSFFHYFDFLPLEHKENIVSCGEGAIPIEEWNFLSEYAKAKYGIDCRAMVYRNDRNGGTGTFKDVAAALGASLFKENGIKTFCVASTGNTATAFSKYLSMAGVKFTVFVPNDVCPDTVEAIRSQGQNIVISKGNYGEAKKEAALFHEQTHTPMSAGNIDPIRVEAKRTMVFEFLRQLGTMPDVYMQAVAGGTGPIAIDKGVREITPAYPETKLPRMLLIQQDTCDPMVQAWEKATQNAFPAGYENDYPSLTPTTNISILSTGTPGMYPIVAPIVRKSGGTFLRVKEAELVDLAKWVKKEKDVILGPASMVCLAGFLQALTEGQIKNGETVLINTGEGSGRAKWFADLVNAK